MSNHYNINQEKCWSCSHYCGERELKYNKFYTSDKAKCAYKKEEVSESSYCWHYKKAGDVAAELAKEENEKLEKELEERKRERQQLEEEIENEKRKRLYEEWYASLSPEEKHKEDERKRLEAIEEKKRQEQLAKEKEIVLKKQSLMNKINDLEKRANLIKSKMSKNIILCIVMTSVAFLFGFMPYFVFNSLKGQNEFALQSWIDLGHSSTDETALEFSANIEMYSSKAQSVLWIPFVILVILIVLSILLIIKTRRKQIVELSNLTNEMNDLKKEIVNVNNELE